MTADVRAQVSSATLSQRRARFQIGAKAVLIIVGVLVLATLATAPHVPYEWDAAAWWIPRAEMERGETGHLLQMMGNPGDWGLLLPGIGTHVYPIAYPVIVGALAKVLPTDVSAMRASALWLAILVVVLFVQVVRRMPSETNAISVMPFAVVLLSPFALVHWRSGYADLSVGLLSALLVVAMDEAFERPTVTRLVWMAVISTLLLQMKEDGLVMCVAVASTMAVTTDRARSMFRRVVGVETLVIIVNIVGWWWLLRSLYGPHMPTTFRAALGFDAGIAPSFAYQVLRHALDIDSWGILWPTLIAVAMWRRDVRWAVFVVIALAGYGLAHAIGPPQMMQYLRDGNVMNRLLLQIAVAAVPFTIDASRRRRT